MLFMPSIWTRSSTRALTFSTFEPALDLEGVEDAPALLVELHAGLLRDGLGDEHGRRAGVEDQVERPLAVDLGADEDVLGVGEFVGDLEPVRFGTGFGSAASANAGASPQTSARVIRRSME